VVTPAQGVICVGDLSNGVINGMPGSTFMNSISNSFSLFLHPEQYPNAFHLNKPQRLIVLAALNHKSLYNKSTNHILMTGNERYLILVSGIMKTGI
jgi:hypothetical protein